MKGSDGAETLRRARELGARPEAAGRAAEALRALLPLRDALRLVVGASEMGELEASAVGLAPSSVLRASSVDTTADDTRRMARAMLDLGADLILFAGGDGTARDIYDAVGDRAVVLGVPAGVKIHSGVYATTPRSAGDLARRYLEGGVRRIVQAEVMDLDEEAFRHGRVSARLYGYLRVPDERSALQGVKASGVAGEAAALREIALDVIERLEPARLYLLGPGTTTRAIALELGLEKTLLGVDVLLDRQLIARDATEADLLRLIATHPATIVVTPIGGQGYVFGRGNQQISPAVIRQIDRDRVLVVATRAKLASLSGQRLLVDSGDEATDQVLRGHMRVITGYGQSAICRVS